MYCIDKQFRKTLYYVMYKLNKTGLINPFKNIVKEGIHTKYRDLWSSDVFNNSKCYNIIIGLFF